MVSLVPAETTVVTTTFTGSTSRLDRTVQCADRTIYEEGEIMWTLTSNDSGNEVLRKRFKRS